MKALVLKEEKKAPVYAETVEPRSANGEVIVKIEAAALNRRDWWITKGLYPNIKIPCIPGSDGAGTLDGKTVVINPGLGWLKKAAFQPEGFMILGVPKDGTMAEYVSVPKEYVHPAPTHLSAQEAAAIPLGGLTAYRALFTRGKVKKGDKVLISGIGGGVATLCALFARAVGADVYVTSGDEEKIEKAAAIGAKGGINYKTEDWAKKLVEQTGKFDLIIDSAAGPGFGQLVAACGPGGRIVLYGGTKGIIQEVNPRQLFWNQLNIMGSTMGSNEEFAEMLELVSKYRIRPVIDHVFDLKDGPQAYALMDDSSQFGKIVLNID